MLFFIKTTYSICILLIYHFGKGLWLMYSPDATINKKIYLCSALLIIFHMQRSLLIFFLFLLFMAPVMAQLSINQDGSGPDNSAMLDLQGSTRGLLIPRITTSARNQIPSPAKGLLIYNSESNEFNIFNGSFWYQLESSFISSTTGVLSQTGGVSINATSNVAPANSAILDISNPGRGILIPRTAISLIPAPTTGLIIYDTTINFLRYYNGTQWVLPCTISTGIAGAPGNQATICTAIGTGTSVTDQSAILDVVSSNKGALIPRLTNVQRDAILPATGLVIYNSSSNNINYFNGASWHQLTTNLLSTPVAGTQVPGASQITWNWNNVAGASGYKWSSTDNYALATDMGNIITFTQGGLACNTSYTCYVWAYNTCGNSMSATLTQFTTGSPPVAPSAGTHVPSSAQIVWNWNTVAGATGYKWGTTNNFATAIDKGSATTTTETGLTCNTGYTRYVWAYSGCGNSTSTILSQTTSLNPPSAPVAGTQVPSPAQIVWTWNAVSGASGYKWNTTNNYTTAVDMGVTTSKTETGLTCNTFYMRYAWAYSSCGVSTAVTLSQNTSLNPPASPVAGTQVPSPTQILWNWNNVAGATGYKWSTSNNYATATDMGSATTTIETGLSCNTGYTRYVWAYSGCGNSSSTILTQTTSLNPPAAPTEGTHVAYPAQIFWFWNSVAGATGYKWSTTNNYPTATDIGTSTYYNETGLNCSTAYTRYVWSYNNCGNSTSVALNQATPANPPTNPYQGTNNPSPTQIIWNWTFVAGAIGYKWSTINDYATAIDMGASLYYTETCLNCNTSYVRYIWAYSGCGVSLPWALLETTLVCGTPCPGTPTVNYSGQVYNTVLVGSQCWLKENLNTGTRIDGAQEHTNNGVVEKYCYGNLESNCSLYGGLYQWNEMMQYGTVAGAQGICPASWHIPTDAEWNALATYLCGSGIAGGKLKTTGTVQSGTGYWNSPNAGATNESGFSAPPGGWRDESTFFYLSGYQGYWWSSSQYSPWDAGSMGLQYSDNSASAGGNPRLNGFSVRCIRDY